MGFTWLAGSTQVLYRPCLSAASRKPAAQAVCPELHRQVGKGTDAAGTARRLSHRRLHEPFNLGKAIKVPAPIPLSGRTMEFDGAGKCSADSSIAGRRSGFTSEAGPALPRCLSSEVKDVARNPCDKQSWC